ncbi:MAG: N-acetyl-gamma-glutamyl-phosphate reductase [Gammaproteobacteria bacterium]|nr:N-acetyl-gamma-glutamyl-phosphate reductase [Gammaproteobacteria bacterium]
MVRATIVGGTGYTGVELLRLLLGHPGVEIVAVTSRAEAGTALADTFPNLRGRCSLVFTDPGNIPDCDVVFFATPNGTAMAQAPGLLDRGMRIIDLAADFRLRQVAEWEHWYRQPHACPELLAEAVYGLPELNRDRIRGARIVANPGCYPTAVALGFLPLVEARLLQPESLVADAKSGVTGAGRRRELGNMFSEVSDSFKAYAVGGHRHLPEIRQLLAGVAGAAVDLVFVPHLVPMLRGIHATLHARLRSDETDLQALFEARYRSEPFVDVLPADSHPDTRSVRGSNTCRIAVHRPPGAGRVVVLSVIDNLVKGAAGQAVQNMNLMFGLEESAGLSALALLP